jgi:hypothetical protein
MIYDEIDHEFHVPLFEAHNELVDVCEGTISWVDVFVVGDVVAEIDLRALEERGRPDDVHFITISKVMSAKAFCRLILCCLPPRSLR